MPVLVITAAEMKTAATHAKAAKRRFAVRLCLAQKSTAPSSIVCNAPSTHRKAKTVIEPAQHHQHAKKNGSGEKGASLTQCQFRPAVWSLREAMNRYQPTGQFNRNVTEQS